MLAPQERSRSLCLSHFDDWFHAPFEVLDTPNNNESAAWRNDVRTLKCQTQVDSRLPGTKYILFHCEVSSVPMQVSSRCTGRGCAGRIFGVSLHGSPLLALRRFLSGTGARSGACHGLPGGESGPPGLRVLIWLLGVTNRDGEPGGQGFPGAKLGQPLHRVPIRRVLRAATCRGPHRRPPRRLRRRLART